MSAIVKKKMKHKLIKMKKEDINPQHNSMKFEVEVPCTFYQNNNNNNNNNKHA